jgi:hypothetical protein
VRPLYDELDDMYDLLYRDGCKLESLRSALQRSQEAIWHLYREAKRAVAVAYWSTKSVELETLQEQLHSVFERAVAAGGMEDIYDHAFHGGISKGHRAESKEIKRVKGKQPGYNIDEEDDDEFLDGCA